MPIETNSRVGCAVHTNCDFRFIGDIAIIAHITLSSWYAQRTLLRWKWQ